MSKEENEKIAKQVIEDFLLKNKQIKVIVAIDDFDHECDDPDDADDYLDFHLHTPAKELDLVSDHNIERQYSLINDGVAFILVDNSNSLTSSQYQTRVFEEREKHLYCKYQFLLDAVKKDSRVELAIIDQQIKLKKS
tara:strand:- start:77 stop:487 length:411 start_codon:yes stop_codon:yes gene_type:complete